MKPHKLRIALPLVTTLPGKKHLLNHKTIFALMCGWCEGDQLFKRSERISPIKSNEGCPVRSKQTSGQPSRIRADPYSSDHIHDAAVKAHENPPSEGSRADRTQIPRAHKNPHKPNRTSDVINIGALTEDGKKNKRWGLYYEAMRFIWEVGWASPVGGKVSDSMNHDVYESRQSILQLMDQRNC